jgi:hypothetical protein
LLKFSSNLIFKIASNLALLVIAVLIGTSSSFAQSDSSGQTNKTYSFSSHFSSIQAEFSTLVVILEYGGLIDFDLFNKESAKKYSFGLRLAYERFSYYEPGGPTGGGPFSDYCLYARHSIKGNKLDLNLLGGMGYHKKSLDGFGGDKINPRIGAELKYKLAGGVVNLICKGSTSFSENTFFIGFGIAVGLYEQ